MNQKIKKIQERYEHRFNLSDFTVVCAYGHDVPVLLDEIDRLTEQIEKLKESCNNGTENGLPVNDKV